MESDNQTLETKVNVPVQKKLPSFDADLPPSNHQNQAAAKARNILYSKKLRGYYDSEGCLIRDEYGQRL